MSSQYTYAAAVAGRTLTAKLYTGATLSYTADTVAESPASSGLYYITFGEATEIDGSYRLIMTDDGASNIGVAQYKVTFTGTDTEAVDALEYTAETDLDATLAEVTGVPAANAGMMTKLNWLFALSRNKGTQTTTTKTLRNDADSGDIATSTISDDGTTFIRNEYS